MREKKPELRLPPWESIPIEQHPVFKHQYTLMTPMIERVFSVVVAWIKNGLTGGYIQGLSALGKTKLRRILAYMLGLVFKRVPIFCVTAHTHIRISENEFFADLLRATKHAMPKAGSAAQKRDRLTEAIVGIVGASGQDRAILIVDQAHLLLELHFDLLVDVYEDLADRGVELFVLLIGEPGLSITYEEFRRNERTQIIRRFMTGRLEFTGVRRKSDFRACLRAYDENSRFPEDTAWTFSRYFYRDAFAKGWRLVDHAPALWNAFEEVYRSAASVGSLEIPMQFLARTVDRFLMEATAVDGDPTRISPVQLVQFVRETGFDQVIRGKVSSRDIDLDHETEETAAKQSEVDSGSPASQSES